MKTAQTIKKNSNPNEKLSRTVIRQIYIEVNHSETEKKTIEKKTSANCSCLLQNVVLQETVNKFLTRPHAYVPFGWLDAGRGSGLALSSTTSSSSRLSEGQPESGAWERIQSSSKT